MLQTVSWCQSAYSSYACGGIILGMGSANERWHYNVMSSPIGWAHTQNDLWFGDGNIQRELGQYRGWSMALQCNTISHWLSPYPEWSLIWGWNIQGELGLYRGCWCPGSLHCQTIASHGIDWLCRIQFFPCLTWEFLVMYPTCWEMIEMHIYLYHSSKHFGTQRLYKFKYIYICIFIIPQIIWHTKA